MSLNGQNPHSVFTFGCVNLRIFWLQGSAMDNTYILDLPIARPQTRSADRRSAPLVNNDLADIRQLLRLQPLISTDTETEFNAPSESGKSTWYLGWEIKNGCFPVKNMGFLE